MASAGGRSGGSGEGGTLCSRRLLLQDEDAQPLVPTSPTVHVAIGDGRIWNKLFPDRLRKSPVPDQLLYALDEPSVLHITPYLSLVRRSLSMFRFVR